MDKHYSIGKLSKLSRVSVDTIRYYEKLGLLKPERRKTSGYRLYSDDALVRLKFIRNAKSLGFTLKEIKELLMLRCNPNEKTCHDVRRKIEKKKNEVVEKINILQKIKAALDEMAKTCKSNENINECPALRSFDF